MDKERLKAIWVTTTSRGESDARVDLFSGQEGALSANARGLLKQTSKMAPVLKPGDELEVELARGRGALPVLAGATCHKSHPWWREELTRTAVAWLIAESSYLASSEPEANADAYRLAVNVLRHGQSDDLLSPSCTYCIKYLKLHGLFPDLDACAVSGRQVQAGEVVHLLPTGEGVVGLEEYNNRYARSSAGLLRLSPESRQAMASARDLPLVEALGLEFSREIAAILLWLVASQIGGMVGRTVGSAEMLAQQLKLPTIRELQSQQA